MAEFVEGALAGRRVAVAVADGCLFDFVEADAGVFDGLRPCFAGHVGIVPIAPTGLFEFGHAYADYERLPTHLSGS